MSYDTLTMMAVNAELQKLAVGARVQRIIQPRREEIVLLIYHRGEECGLLLSCHPHQARVHLTSEHHRRPDQPPPFCMLLRKYLTGARITAITQPPLERVLKIQFTAHEGLPAVTLIAEIMGRRSNLLLIDDSGIILGAVQTATREQNPRRAVLSGYPYEEVPPQEKLNPLSTPLEELSRAMHPLLAEGLSPDKALLKVAAGVSPLAARELLYRSNWDDQAPHRSLERLHGELKALFNLSDRAVGAYFYPGQKLYSSYPLTHLQEAAGECFDNMNELLDHFYGKVTATAELKILQGQLRSRVDRRRSRLESKLEQHREELQKAGEADRFRICGETLLTYGARIARGEHEAVLPHLYDPEKTITIPLNPSLGAVDNAQRYFRRYRKIRDSREHHKKQIARIERELNYCSELLFSIEQGDHGSLEEIREELVEAGLMKPPRKRSFHKNKKRRREAPQPLSFKGSSGVTILVGRNNRQNDHLTFRLAAKRDLWLHARELPGSHVILKEGSDPPAEDDLQEAALLAAYFSRGRELPAVAVDYTGVRHLRRGPGGKPGFVLYNQFKTITVDPRDEKVKQLLEQQNS